MEPFRILIRLGVITVFGTNCHHVTKILSGIEVEIALPKMPKFCEKKEDELPRKKHGNTPV